MPPPYLEIPLSAAFESTVEDAMHVIGPKIVIFEKFTTLYCGANFDKHRYAGCTNDNFFLRMLGVDEFDNISMFCREILRTELKRGDYAELLKLIVIL